MSLVLLLWHRVLSAYVNAGCFLLLMFTFFTRARAEVWLEQSCWNRQMMHACERRGTWKCENLNFVSILSWKCGQVMEGTLEDFITNNFESFINYPNLQLFLCIHLQIMYDVSSRRSWAWPLKYESNLFSFTPTRAIQSCKKNYYWRLKLAALERFEN